jgi:hypothetical protein
MEKRNRLAVAARDAAGLIAGWAEIRRSGLLPATARPAVEMRSQQTNAVLNSLS